MRDRLLPLFSWALSTRQLHRILALPESVGYVTGLLRYFGATIGENTRVYTPLTLVNARRDFTNLILGNNVYLGHGAVLDLKERIVVEDNVTISMGATMATHFHVGEIPMKARFPSKSGPICIRGNVYLGSNVVVLSGVEIGGGSVIGAGAVVIGDVPPGVVAGGVPARVLKMIE
jgi:acetyltransferase-like isoleucine patch superfamily enzyme